MRKSWKEQFVEMVLDSGQFQGCDAGGGADDSRAPFVWFTEAACLIGGAGGALKGLSEHCRIDFGRVKNVASVGHLDGVKN